MRRGKGGREKQNSRTKLEESKTEIEEPEHKSHA